MYAPSSSQAPHEQHKRSRIDAGDDDRDGTAEDGNLHADSVAAIEYVVKRDYDGTSMRGIVDLDKSVARFCSDVRSFFSLDTYTLLAQIEATQCELRPQSIAKLSTLGFTPGTRYMFRIVNEELDETAANNGTEMTTFSSSTAQAPLAITDGSDSIMTKHAPVVWSVHGSTAANASSPTATTGLGTTASAGTTSTSIDSDDDDDDSSSKEEGYVGLANQGATCYLNSLLQSLYMTPEFRRAVYLSKSSTTDELTIPGELQKLFLNLQTSSERAIPTTNITKSFGWEGSEAFQQHDVQELLRVLFDALEEEWQGTPQAQTIKSLYEGEMVDFVKCLECNFVSKRTDTYMDLPLVIRPFGSKDVMKSVRESMCKFVEVEKMEDDNKYHCSKCDKKVEALKGLKYKKFPYILTFQLKRFDFDYTTFNRIKLNSKFSFPTELNVAEFLESGKELGLDELSPTPSSHSDGPEPSENASDNDNDDGKQENVADSEKESEEEVVADDTGCNDATPADVLSSPPPPYDADETDEPDAKADHKTDAVAVTDVDADGATTRASDDFSADPVTTYADAVSTPSEKIDDSAVLAFAGIDADVGDDTGAVVPPPSYDDAVSQIDTPASDASDVTDNANDADADDSAPIDLDGTRMLTGEPRAKAIADGTLYELFSILIHRGSALGGHYFAFIKSLDDGKWHTFNDSSVTPLSFKKLTEAYGGAVRSSYYSQSSTSGYMLMYRRISDQNQRFPTVDDLPEALMESVREMQEEQARIQAEKERLRRQFTFEIAQSSTSCTRVVVDKDDTFQKILETACQALELDPAQHRLCKYHMYTQNLDKPVQLSATISEEFKYNHGVKKLHLQKRNENGTFDVIDPSKLTMLIRVFDLETATFNREFNVSVAKSGTYEDLVDLIKEKLYAGKVPTGPTTTETPMGYQPVSSIDSDPDEGLDDGDTSTYTGEVEEEDDDESNDSNVDGENKTGSEVTGTQQDATENNTAVAGDDEQTVGQGEEEKGEEEKEDQDQATQDDEQAVDDKDSGDVHGDKLPELALIKGGHMPRRMRPGSLSRINYIYSNETIYVTTEELPSRTIDLGDTKTMQAIEFLQNQIEVRVHIPAELDQAPVGDESAKDSSSECATATDATQVEANSSTPADSNASLAKAPPPPPPAPMIISVAAGAKERVITIKVDKTMNLGTFKQTIVQPLVTLYAPDNYRMFRDAHSSMSQRVELRRYSENLSVNYITTFPDVYLVKGEAPKIGYIEIGLNYMDLSEDDTIEMFKKIPIPPSAPISEIKKAISERMLKQAQDDNDWKFKNLPTDPSRFRLWNTFSYDKPLSVIHDKLHTNVYYHKIYLLEILEEGEENVGDDKAIVFGRKLDLSTCEYGALKTFAIDKAATSADDFLDAMETYSGVPKEHLRFISSFSYPYKEPIAKCMGENWLSIKRLSDISCTTDSSGFVFTDARVEKRELSADEKKKLKNKAPKHRYSRAEPALVIKRKSKKATSTAATEATTSTEALSRETSATTETETEGEVSHEASTVAAVAEDSSDTATATDDQAHTQPAIDSKGEEEGEVELAQNEKKDK